MTTEVLAAIKQHADQTTSTLEEMQKSTDKRIKELDSMVIDLAQRNTGSWAGMQSKKSTGIASMIEDSGLLAGLRSRASKSVQIPLDIAIKAIVSDTAAGTNTQFVTETQRGQVIGEDKRRRLTLIDILPVLPVNAGTFEFVQLDSYTNAADYQAAQGDKKAAQTTATEIKTANIATIAIIEKASEQVIADSPALANFLTTRMTFNVRHKLEQELIGGVGGAGKIAGLSTSGTVFTPSLTAKPVDRIGEAQAALDAAGWTASAVLLHPTDWQAMRSERSTDGIYLAGGWNESVTPNIFGVPVVTSPALTVGQAIVLDASQVALLDRQQAAFAFNYSEDGFERNVITARAELRAGLAVMSPSAVLKVNVAIA